MLSHMSGTVTVRGAATIRVAPDEGHLEMSLFKVDRRPEDAHADVAWRAGELEMLLDELGIAPADRTTTGVSVAPESEWTGSRWQRKGWRASMRTSLRLHDASVVGRLIAEAVDRVEAAVSGPWWVLTPDHPSRIEVCSAATQDARTRAEAYARGVGLGLGDVVEIREPGTGHRPGGGMDPFTIAAPVATPMAMRAFSDQGQQQPPPPEVNVEPGEVDVSCAVEVTFALAPSSS